jgi:hypothetical protein
LFFSSSSLKSKKDESSEIEKELGKHQQDIYSNMGLDEFQTDGRRIDRVVQSSRIKMNA